MSKARVRCGLRRRTSLVHEVQQQVCLTLAGSGIVTLVFAAYALIYMTIFKKTFKAIQQTAQSQRNTLLEEVLEAVAMTLVPLHRSVTRLAQRLQHGSDPWLPPQEFFIQPSKVHINSLAAWLHAELAKESRIHSVSSNGDGASPLPIKRMGASVALAPDLRTIVSFDKCAHAVRFYLRETISGKYEVLAQHTERSLEGGGRRIASTSYVYNPSTVRTRNPVLAGVASCENSLRGLPETLNGTFGNWSWTYQSDLVEPSDGTPNSARLILHGVAPIYSPDRTRAVGRVYATTDNEAFSRALAWVLAKNRTAWTGGGHFLLADRDGRILAQTELLNSPEVVMDLPRDSHLFRATAAVVDTTGGLCPERTVAIDRDTRLVDVRNFHAEAYGMPPMGALRWCVIMTLPRDSIYGPIDSAQRQVEISAVVILVVSLVSLALLLLALFFGSQERKRLELQKLRMDLRKVDEAMKEVKELNCPMALISSEDFLALETLEHHEALRDRRKLVVLDSLDGDQGILKFQEQCLIAFISHQWLGFNFPDVEGAGQLRIMQDAIRRCMEDPIDGKGVYVWVDYISIPQCHSQLQSAAVSSLPVYASVADVFIIVAPTLQHADTHHACNLETYMRRGWCRAEMLSKACASGLKDMYVATGEQEGVIQVLSNAHESKRKSSDLLPLRDVSAFSLNVFEGEFTVESDQEVLVKPVLGLYSLVLGDPSSEHLRQIHSYILEDEEAFFPRMYCNGKGEHVELFGPCVQLLHNVVMESSESGN